MVAQGRSGHGHDGVAAAKVAGGLAQVGFFGRFIGLSVGNGFDAALGTGGSPGWGKLEEAAVEGGNEALQARGRGGHGASPPLSLRKSAMAMRTVPLVEGAASAVARRSHLSSSSLIHLASARVTWRSPYRTDWPSRTLR
ncbi:hypothetical protein LOD49_09555 [Xylella fastidiosa subsp. multiplex]|uniref:hypothetical protein n=1 Tax=Xylella fastidiosa TaxID=2371 RepID=UPI001EEA45DE|nr:hypothetical protein [Xylella fastidiosa]MDD0868437.1 hypothetical protein [Xylella fastidiosa subsp. multiplex]MDD0959372.1 hypothetical protein [Xylella fastidiosa subsp. multiplex]